MMPSMKGARLELFGVLGLEIGGEPVSAGCLPCLLRLAAGVTGWVIFGEPMELFGSAACCCVLCSSADPSCCDWLAPTLVSVFAGGAGATLADISRLCSQVCVWFHNYLSASPPTCVMIFCVVYRLRFCTACHVIVIVPLDLFLLRFHAL